MINRIREIRQNTVDGRYTLEILEPDEKRPRIVANYAPSFGRDRRERQQVNFETTRQRLIEFANEILIHFDKKRKYEDWKPTFKDLESRLGEYFPTDGFYMWIVDYMRQHPDDAKRVKDWLQIWTDL